MTGGADIAKYNYGIYYRREAEVGKKARNLNMTYFEI